MDKNKNKPPGTWISAAETATITGLTLRTVLGRAASGKMKAKILRDLDLLEEKGNTLREPYSKHLDDGIFELRAKVGSDISRVLYFFYVRHRIIVTNGFVKKTQKTPKSEIEKAKEYRKEYLERKEDSQ